MIFTALESKWLCDISRLVRLVIAWYLLFLKTSNCKIYLVTNYSRIFTSIVNAWFTAGVSPSLYIYSPWNCQWMIFIDLADCFFKFWVYLVWDAFLGTPTWNRKVYTRSAHQLVGLGYSLHWAGSADAPVLCAGNKGRSLSLEENEYCVLIYQGKGSPGHFW